MINQRITELKSEAESIDNMAHELFQNAPILYRPLNEPNSSSVVLGFSDYRWGNLDEKLGMLQDSLLTKYDGWFSAGKELVNIYSSDRSESFIENYVKARNWIELKKEIWNNEKEKKYQDFHRYFKVQMDIISSLEKIIEITKSIEDSEKPNANLTNESDLLKDEFSILKYRMDKLESDLEGQRKNTYSLANGTKSLEVTIQNIAKASSETGDISIEVKNEVIIQSIKPILDNELNSLMQKIQADDHENKTEIIELCGEILLEDKPNVSGMKNKLNSLKSLLKVTPQLFQTMSVILQIINSMPATA
jgi:hypothetical protein